MIQKKVVFRCDASPHIGGGHVMRCVTLADALRRCGWQVLFSCDEITLEAMPIISDQGFEVDRSEQSCDLLIIDHYGLDYMYENAARSWANKIMVIDDLADRQHDCDLLLDQTYGREDDDYNELVPSGCRILTGTEYALLRSQFVTQRANSLKYKTGKLDRILVFMSSMDEYDVTGTVLNSLKDTAYEIDVVLGATAPHRQSVEKQVRTMKNATLHLGISDMAGLMVQADLAIGAGGTTSWERCVLGLPSLIIEIADNQNKIVRELAQAGAVVYLGHMADITSESIITILDNLSQKPETLRAMKKTAAALCDGQGTKRVVEVINEL